MGDRIVVMKDGFIQQVNKPQVLYDKPCNLFVAGFIGYPQMNTLDATLVEKDGAIYVNFEKYSMKLPDSKVTPELKEFVGKEIVLGVRPEHVHDEPRYFQDLPADWTIEADVDVTELMGAETYLFLST